MRCRPDGGGACGARHRGAAAAVRERPRPPTGARDHLVHGACSAAATRASRSAAAGVPQPGDASGQRSGRSAGTARGGPAGSARSGGSAGRAVRSAARSGGSAHASRAVRRYAPGAAGGSPGRSGRGGLHAAARERAAGRPAGCRNGVRPASLRRAAARAGLRAAAGAALVRAQQPPEQHPSGQPHPEHPGPSATGEPGAGPETLAPDAADERSADPRATLDDSPQPAAGGSANGEGAPLRDLSGEGDTLSAAMPRCVACGTGAVDADGYCEHCGHKQPRERDHMERELPSAAAASDRGLPTTATRTSSSCTRWRRRRGSPATIAVVCDGVSSATRPDDASAAAARAGRARPCARASLKGAAPPAGDAQCASCGGGGRQRPCGGRPERTLEERPGVHDRQLAHSVDGILTIGWIGDSRAYWVPERPCRTARVG